jgi:CHASE3 domain sensor protein
LGCRDSGGILAENTEHVAAGLPAPLDASSLRLARRWLRLLFFVVPMMLVPLLWASVRLSTDLREVDRTHEKMDLVFNARAAARQSREVLHGYLQSGNPEQLASYQRSTGLAWREVWHFKELTLDNPRQVANSQRFEQRLGDTFKLGDELLAEKKAGNPRSLAARVAAEEAINDGLRDAVRALVDEERGQLAAHERALAISVRTLQIISSLFAGVLLFLGYHSWRRVDMLLSLAVRR